MLGTVEVGKVANLVLLEANPLEEMRHILQVEMVISEGQMVDLRQLQMMRALPHD